MTANRKVWIVASVSLLGVVGALAGIKGAQIMAMIRAGESFVPPPESVSAAKVEAGKWEQTKPAVASLVAARGVTVSAELPGKVRAVSFESGASIKRRQVLVQLDTSLERAQLESAIAEASLARTSLTREEALIKGGVTTQASLDAARARAKQADAAVAALQATIAKKTIRAPFDGRISIRDIEVGQVVAAGTPIASLQSVTPIDADFWLPQQALAELQVDQQVRMTADPFPGTTWGGKVTAVNPEVDPATRNVRVRATFENADGRLRPGMFANVEVLSAKLSSVMLVPATAIIYAPYGDSVFVLEEKANPSGPAATVARQRFVRVGERRGDFVAISSGLQGEETVVSAGAFKLRNGAAVVVNNSLAFAPELAPTPLDR